MIMYIYIYIYIYYAPELTKEKLFGKSRVNSKETCPREIPSESFSEFQ